MGIARVHTKPNPTTVHCSSVIPFEAETPVIIACMWSFVAVLLYILARMLLGWILMAEMGLAPGSRLSSSHRGWRVGQEDFRTVSWVPLWVAQLLSTDRPPNQPYPLVLQGVGGVIWVKFPVASGVGGGGGVAC